MAQSRCRFVIRFTISVLFRYLWGFLCHFFFWGGRCHDAFYASLLLSGLISLSSTSLSLFTSLHSLLRRCINLYVTLSRFNVISLQLHHFITFYVTPSLFKLFHFFLHYFVIFYKTPSFLHHSITFYSTPHFGSSKTFYALSHRSSCSSYSVL